MSKHNVLNRFAYGNLNSGGKMIVYQHLFGRLFYVTEDYSIEKIERELLKRDGEYVVNSARGRRLATYTVKRGGEY
jgi:hypothetical protein